MSAQDRDLLFVALMSGAAMVLSLSGVAWGVVGIINLIIHKEES